MRPDDFFAAVESRQGLSIPALRFSYTPPTMTLAEAMNAPTDPPIPNGKCHRCGCDVAGRKQLWCAECLRIRRIRQQVAYQRAVRPSKAKTCVDCGATIGFQGTRCRSCAAVEHNKRRRDATR